MRPFFIAALLPVIALALPGRNNETFNPIAILPRQADTLDGHEYTGIKITSYHGKNCKKKAFKDYPLYYDYPDSGSLRSYRLSTPLLDGMQMHTFDDRSCKNGNSAWPTPNGNCVTFDRTINCLKIIHV